MALGGGTWVTQNKVLPGTYINIISKNTVTPTLSERGTVALALALPFGPFGVVKSIGENPEKELLEFGVDINDDTFGIKFRELFAGATKVLVTRLNGTGGVKASNSFATAKYVGTFGNNIAIAISVNADDEDKFDVYTYLGNEIKDVQTVADATGLVSNELVDFISSATLTVTVKTSLSGGVDVTPSGTAHTDALALFEAYNFNILCCDSSDSSIKGVYKAYTERLRDTVGKKFQLVVNNLAANYEGVINYVGSADLVYWVAGKESGCDIATSLTNTLYDGEVDYTPEITTQSALEEAINAGQLVFHLVEGQARLLSDINSLTEYTENKGKIFSKNQTVRICDQIANDIAVLFNTSFLGKVTNEDAGRTLLRSEIADQLKLLSDKKAIGLVPFSNISVEQGEDKDAVLCNLSGVVINNTMEKLYMNIVIE